jgi:hypothetical protein
VDEGEEDSIITNKVLRHIILDSNNRIHGEEVHLRDLLDLSEEVVFIVEVGKIEEAITITTEEVVAVNPPPKTTPTATA